MPPTTLAARGELLNGLRLITGGLERADELEVAHILDYTARPARLRFGPGTPISHPRTV